MDPDKTDEQKLVSGFNLETELDVAMMELTLAYEHFSHKQMNATPPDSGNKPIKAFHFIQSFAPGECDAETAHKIGLEWVRKSFGEDFQAMVCTHTDKKHIHNHILLCPYSLKGRKFNSNKSTLQTIRDVSDGICRDRGIGVMAQILSHPDYESSGVSYGEWKHRKMGTSWKERIRVRIDLLVESVNSLDELLSILEEQGYTIKRGKYISIKAPEQKKAVRLKTLGVRYEEYSLVRRIEKSVAKRPKPKSIDEIIDDVLKEYSSETRKYSFAQSVQTDIYSLNHQLSIINKEHINSIGELEGKLAQVNKKIADIENKIREGEITSWQIDNYSEMLKKLRQQQVDYQSIVDTYYDASSGDYISRLVREAKSRMTEQEKAKLQHLKEMKYEIYFPNDNISCAFADLKNAPNIQNYSKAYEDSWYDVEGNSIGEQLECIYKNKKFIGVGAVIKVSGDAYYVDTRGYKQLRNFDAPIQKPENKAPTQKKNTKRKKGSR